MKKFPNGKTEETHVYHAIREKLRHQLRHLGRALDLKTKDLIVSSFCTVFEKNCTALNQSKWRNFFMYKIIISIGNSMICSDIWHKYHE